MKIVKETSLKDSHVIQDIPFSQREMDVIACVLHCRGSKKIADFLSISPKTVEAHIRNITLKLGCHGREGIIDFLENSEKFLWLKKHYFSLLKKSLLNKQLKIISKEARRLGLVCTFDYELSSKVKKAFVLRLKQHLALAGITVQTQLEKRGPSTVKNFYTLVDVSIEQSGEEPIGKIYVCFPGDAFLSGTQLSEKNIINFSEDKNYNHNILRILHQMIPELDIKKHLSETEFNNSQWQQDNFVEAPEESRKKEKKSFYFKKGPSFFLAAVIGLVFVIFLNTYFGNNTTENQTFIRSDLPIPTKDQLLERPLLLNQIRKQLSVQEGIRKVALVGEGGTGKTTLARCYGQKQDTELVWEIQAATRDSLLDSFRSLAYTISYKSGDQNELRIIERIDDLNERSKQILFYVKDRLRKFKGWILIYDNVEKFSKIRDFFPSDPKTWGEGKVIMTTQNANIENSLYIGAKNVIKIDTLEEKEKLLLFKKVLSVKPDRILKSNALRAFIKKLPPFPLDISVAAYYLRNSGMSYEQYLKSLNNRYGQFFLAQENLLRNISGYTKTRYSIISLSLEKILEEDPKFHNLLFILSLIDAQNIPLALFKYSQEQITLDNFLHHLRQYSLIQFDNEVMDSFSMHPSTQGIILQYLENYQQRKPLDIEASLVPVAKYMSEVARSLNELEMRRAVRHSERLIKKSQNIKTAKTSQILSSLGRLYYYLGEDEKAVVAFQKSLPFYYDIEETKLAWIKIYLGKAYRNLGYYDKAKKFLEESCLIYKKHLTENPLDFAWTATHLGNVYRSLGYLERAKTILEKAVTIYKQHYDSQHIKIAWASVHLANVHEALGNYEVSRQLLQRYYPVFCNYYGRYHILTTWVKTCMGKVYQRIGKSEEAEEILRETLSRYESYYGKNHIQTAWVLRAIGRVYLLKQNFEKAELFLRRSFGILDKKRNPDRYRSLELIADWHHQKARVFFEQDQIKEAIKHREKAREALQQVYKIVQENFHHNSPHLRRLSLKLTDFIK